ncbi:MAG: hydrogenase maturation protease [Clostridiaceae bacterium]
MRTKLIAIGNRLMGDDSAAVKAAEILSEKLKELGIEVVIGETDFEFCLSEADKDDFVIVMDSSGFGIEPGTVTVLDFKDIQSIGYGQGLLSQHGYSFISALRSCFPHIEGKIIGIEGCDFELSLSLSSELEKEFYNICSRIEKICRGIKNI